MKYTNSILLVLSLFCIHTVCSETPCALNSGNGNYNPLEIDVEFKPQILNLLVKDIKRNREITLLVYLPRNEKTAPVVLFSHGLGGSVHGSEFLGRHLSARGYVVVFMQHPGSDESVWKGKPKLQGFVDLKKAASGQSFMQRVEDVPAVIDRLQLWNKDRGSKLYNRLDLENIGMSGHSFGAVTSQAVSGQIFMGKPRFSDKRIKAAIMYSPSTPRSGGNARSAFSNIKIPWLLMTGTNDTVALLGIGMDSRLEVYPALPNGDKYELVLYKAEHSAFTDRKLPGDKLPRNPEHHKSICAISAAFWDAYLTGNKAALQWLQAPGKPSVLQPDDHWQHK